MNIYIYKITGTVYLFFDCMTLFYASVFHTVFTFLSGKT